MPAGGDDDAARFLSSDKIGRDAATSEVPFQNAVGICVFVFRDGVGETAGGLWVGLGCDGVLAAVGRGPVD